MRTVECVHTTGTVSSAISVPVHLDLKGRTVRMVSFLGENYEDGESFRGEL